MIMLGMDVIWSESSGKNDLLQCLGKLREFYFELGKIDII